MDCVMRLPSFGEMRNQRRHVKGSARSRTTGESLRRGRLALVLSGGGGKGAYELGCLRALRDNHISEFHAIAGTSVGALNASLLAQDGLSAAKKIWHDISFGQVLRAHPIGFLTAVALRLALAPMFALKAVPSFWEATEAFGSYRKVGFKPAVACMEAVARLLGPLVRVALLSMLAAAAYHGMFGRHIPGIGSARFWMVVAFTLPFAITLWWTAFKLHNTVADKFALFSNEPLQRLVADRLEPSKIRNASFATYVTLATLRWVQIYPGDEKRAEAIHSFMNFRLRYTPIYKDLRELSDDGIREHVIQSAGLPEVFPRRVVSGAPVVDGGLADNTPIKPVLEADAFVVIYLNAHLDAPRLIKSERIRIDKILNTPKPVPADVAFLHAAVLATARQKQQAGDPANTLETAFGVARPFLAIIPSRKLGGLITGTMNFSARKARRLMWLGYWDTLNALKEEPMSWFSNKPTPDDTRERDEVICLSRRAADGDSAAQYELGIRYQQGRGVAVDQVEAIRLFERASAGGVAAATGALAFGYLNGLGVAKDIAKGLPLLQKAAGDGYDMAQATLGMFYVTGQLLPLNYSEGVKWLGKAADQGNPVGLVGLGQCYEIGAGVAADYVETYKLYLLGLKKYRAGSGQLMEVGARDVEERMKALKTQMTPEQVATAERRAAEH